MYDEKSSFQLRDIGASAQKSGAWAENPSSALVWEEIRKSWFCTVCGCSGILYWDIHLGIEGTLW